MTVLAHLTGNSIKDIAELDEGRVEGILGSAIIPGNAAPLFHENGMPILKTDGSQLVLSYTHATAFAAYVAASLTGKSDDFHLKDVRNLPVPFWRPVHAFIASADNYAILAVRSNATRNAIGISLHTAAGYPKVISGHGASRGETMPENFARELFEETALDIDDIIDRTVPITRLAGLEDGKLDQYQIKVVNGDTVPGIVPARAGFRGEILAGSRRDSGAAECQ